MCHNLCFDYDNSDIWKYVHHKYMKYKFDKAVNRFWNRIKCIALNLKVRKNIIFQWLHIKGSWDWAHPSRGQPCLAFRGFLSQLHSVWVCKVNLIFNFRKYLMEITLYWNLPSRDELFYVIFLSLFLHNFPLPPDLKDLKAILSQFWQFVANYVC